MLISHKHRFIFIKTNKTASTSTEISLSRYCGPEDVVPPLNPEGEAIRKQISVRPRNYRAELSEYGPIDHFNRVFRSGKKRYKQRFWSQMTATEVNSRIDDEIWNSYFKFAFDRNPWDKTISEYYWRTRNKQHIDMNQYFETYDGQFVHHNYPIYSLNGELAVDFVGQYEHLERDLTHALAQVGIEFDGWLPRAKGNARKDRRHYSEVLSQEQCEIVRRNFSKEINLLGYEFEERRAA